MKIGSFDFETMRFRAELMAPPPVCLAWATEDPPSLGLVPAHRAPLRELVNSDTVWGGANIAYDMAVALAWGVLTPSEVFGAYERDQIIDLSVFERLAEIGGWTSRKSLSLSSLARVYGLGELEKGEVRTSYDPLYLAELEAYSQKQIEYPLNDAVAGLTVFRRQLERWGDRVNLTDVAQLSRKHFWLHLVSVWGLKTDPTRVEVLDTATSCAVDELQALAKEAGFVRADGSRNMKAIRAAVSHAFDGTPPMTEPKKGRKSDKSFVPQVRTDKDTLISCGDPLLEALADYGSWKKIQSTDLVFLREGTRTSIHSKFGLADTTRTTSAKPNVQNITRAARKDCKICGKSSPAFLKVCGCGAQDWAERQGIRECFLPRSGYCYVAIDHSGLELCTLAQVCCTLLGRYDMAGKINRGENLHLHVGAQILGVSYEEALARRRAGDRETENARGLGKVVNFGRPGGMSAPTLALYAKQSYGISLDVEEAQRLIVHWERANPDGVAFLRYVRSLKRGDRFDVVIPGTTIQRNQTTYCSAANCHFQGLGAALEAAVGWEIARRQFLGDSPLSECRTCNFVHDEFIVECPIGLQTEVARELHEILTGPIARQYLPDVQIQAEFAAMGRWSKFAKEKYDEKGKLLIWGAPEEDRNQLTAN